MTTVVRAVQTCHGCPSQWDAWDENGQYLYLRFRHGYGSAEAQPGPYEESKWTDDPALVADFEVSDGWAGVISLEEFCQRAGLTLALEEQG